MRACARGLCPALPGARRAAARPGADTALGGLRPPPAPPAPPAAGAQQARDGHPCHGDQREHAAAGRAHELELPHAVVRAVVQGQGSAQRTAQRWGRQLAPPALPVCGHGPLPGLARSSAPPLAWALQRPEGTHTHTSPRPACRKLWRLPTQALEAPGRRRHARHGALLHRRAAAHGRPAAAPRGRHHPAAQHPRQLQRHLCAHQPRLRRAAHAGHRHQLAALPDVQAGEQWPSERVGGGRAGGRRPWPRSRPGG